ncbi:GDYXXLXY domain-containing protein [Erythrobacter tepidarius]|uniref:GDYXXLXY domain-containing protein n=1 Tax=Erythrobacter tepidarius TaxID=60454 RepID=UPI000A3CC756|nr:GDYXXLXY domain-containing protein [Erythrobacter tepidarius]
MMRAARLLAALLPLAGLAGLWVHRDRHYRSGTEWEVPIMGYDPRDFLRGHYVEFSYDWPGLDLGVPGQGAQALCIEGSAPRIARVSLLKADAACAHRLIAHPGHVYGASALERGRLYVGQERAMALQQRLQQPDQRGIVTIRLREDGSFTPVSIRFRPLTQDEIAAREAQDEGAEDMRPPPPIMAE